MRVEIQRVLEYRIMCPCCRDFVFYCYDDPIVEWTCPDCRVTFEITERVEEQNGQSKDKV